MQQSTPFKAWFLVPTVLMQYRHVVSSMQARQTAEKYRGLSSDDVMRRGGGLGGYGSGHGSSGYSSGSIASTGFGGSPSGGAGNAGGHRAGSESHKLTGPGGGGNAHSKAPPVDEDPFEATRKRIELLRASGHPPSPLTGTAALQASEQQHSPVPGSIDMDASPNLFPGEIACEQLCNSCDQQCYNVFTYNCV